MATTLTDNQCRTCGGSTGTSITDHEAAPDPHTQYLTETEANGLYAATGDGAAAVTSHEAAADPHPNYLLETDAASTYRTAAQVTASITTHSTNPDPHSVYKLETEVDAEIAERTGWTTHEDSALTSGSPLTLVADTDTLLTNDDATTVSTQAPGSPAVTFYDGTDLLAAEGDALLVQVEFVVEATAATDWIDVWVDNNGTEMSRQTFSLPKGTTAQNVLWSALVPADASFETNNGQVTIRSNAAVDVYDVVFKVARGHKAT